MFHAYFTHYIKGRYHLISKMEILLKLFTSQFESSLCPTYNRSGQIGWRNFGHTINRWESRLGWSNYVSRWQSAQSKLTMTKQQKDLPWLCEIWLIEILSNLMDIHYFIAKKHLKFSGFVGFHSRVGWPGFWKSKLVNWPANVDFEGVGWGPAINR